MKDTKFRISKWIFLSLSIIFNGLIISYSILSNSVANEINAFFTNLFSRAVNDITKKEVVTVPITELDIDISDDQYNFIPGYETNEIPLGSAKQITRTFKPYNATDTAVEYYTTDNDIVTLNPSGEKLSVVGMKTGVATIYAKNKLSGLISSCEVEVVDTVAPTQYEISASKYSVELGNFSDIIFDIDGGPLGHKELYNFRYYDTRLLDYVSSDESVAIVENGVIYPKSIGTTTITVSNGTITKEIGIEVVDGEPIKPYTDLKIGGSTFCYANDFINNKNNFQLTVSNGETVLDPESFIWETSNELLARVDRHGVLRGFRKSTFVDEEVTVRATSKITKQVVEYNVVVKEELPDRLSFNIIANNKDNWNPGIYTGCIGDKTIVKFYPQPTPTNKDMVVTSSDESIISVTNQGSQASLNLNNTGTATISFYCVINPAVSGSVKITVLNAGAMNSNDIANAGSSMRKIVGHAGLFMITQIFTFIAFYMFLHKNKMWTYLSLSVFSGLLLANISELIEYYVPLRTGTIKDVFIDFAGVVVGAIICAAVFLLRKLIKYKKSKTEKDNQF